VAGSARLVGQQAARPTHSSAQPEVFVRSAIRTPPRSDHASRWCHSCGAPSAFVVRSRAADCVCDIPTSSSSGRVSGFTARDVPSAARLLLLRSSSPSALKRAAASFVPFRQLRPPPQVPQTHHLAEGPDEGPPSLLQDPSGFSPDRYCVQLANRQDSASGSIDSFRTPLSRRVHGNHGRRQTCRTPENDPECR